jgi:hypothetical protein
MSKQTTLTGVSAADVEQVCADFKSEGATVTSQVQSDGTYTVVATWG